VGEAISWHLSEELNLDSKKTKHCFHEITKMLFSKQSITHEIDYNLVNAQQAVVY
jgi:DNA topoisomerase-1